MPESFLLNRACKLLISSSDDSVLYDPLEEREYIDVTAENVSHEVKENANTEVLNFESVEEAEVVSEEVVAAENEVPETLTFENEVTQPEAKPQF